MLLLGRANHRRAAWLALGALWLQFVLAFGHLHPEDFAGLGAAQTQILRADSAGGPGSPLDPLDEAPGHENCAICASVHLAGSLALPEPILLAAPLAVGIAVMHAGRELLLVRTPYSLFQTRAPPIR